MLDGECVKSAFLSYLRENHRGETFVTVSPSFADSHPLVRLASGSYLAPHGAMLVES
jgi:hypothetical protein